MTFARTILVLNALIWAGFGLFLFICPETLGGVELAVESATARIEVRGFYGGLELGIAAFLSWAALDPTRFRTGLMGAVCTAGGLATGRLAGIAIEGTGSPQMFAYFGCEVLGFSLSLVALKRLERRT